MAAESDNVVKLQERFDAEAAAERASDVARPVIRLQAGQLHVYASQAEQAIADQIYMRGQHLVRLGRAPELSSAARKLLKRSAEQRVIVPTNVEYLRRRLNTVREFQKFSRTRNQWEPTDCPADLALNILHAGDWEHFRALEALATAPFLRSDLTVCDAPGYDAASRVFYAPNGEFPPVPTRPSKDDAVAALERLSEPFKQFPFAGVSEAAFLCHVLAAAGRHAIDTMPVFAYTAPIVATGKTLLATMANRISDGVEPGVHPYTDVSEELRKVLMSALLAGDSTVLLDNVPNGSKVRSPILCGFVTAAVYTDRKLGVSESPSLPNRCGVVLTGNNITPAGDLARRCLIVRLDFDAETARGRQFEIPNLKAYVSAHRPQLLVDAVTIILAFAQASDTGKLPNPLDSFEAFSRVARDPLVWLGRGDAVETQLLETEDELNPLREAFDKLTASPEFAVGKQFAARDVAKICYAFAGEDLRAAIEAAGCSDASDARKVGYWLREHRDRVAGGRKLTSPGSTGGMTRWTFRSPGR
jgi:putative DNA primase/helicase